jgi:hypothetical protein
MRSGSWLLGALTVLLLLCSEFGIGQVKTDGRIVGAVTDQTGAVIAGASVTATNDATLISLTTQSNGQGLYSFNNVQIGVYTLKVSAPSFEALVVKNTAVELNTTTTQNLALKLGEASSTVTVTSESSLDVLDTTSAQVATNISAELIENLPNLNRDPLTAATMVPGVYGLVVGGPPTNSEENDWMGANGLSTSNSTYTLDGADAATAMKNGASQIPNPDAIEEVQVVTSGGEAQMGAGPGLNINVVTKSGTNTLHGGAFYQLHSKTMNANGWLNDNEGVTKPGDNQRWAGATLGGPIIKDKTFFFFSVQNWRDPQPFTVAGTDGLTAAMVNGDFSAISSSSGQDCGASACAGFQIYDPLTGQPFTGNVIPQSRMNQMSQAMVADGLFSDPQDIVPQFGDHEVWPWMGSLTNTEWTLKLDHQLTKSQKLTFMMYRSWGQNESPSYLSSLPAWGYNTSDAEQKDYSIHHTWTARRDLVLETAYHFSYRPYLLGIGGQKVQKNYQAYTPNFGETVAGQHSAEYLPNLLLGNFWSNMGGYEDWPDSFEQKMTDVTEGVTFYKGKHNLKAGFEYKHAWFSSIPAMDRAQMSYNGNFTSAPSSIDPATGQPISGNNPSGTVAGAYSFADFLLGTAAGVQADTPLFYQSNHIDHWIYYLSDQWKVQSRLTLSLGFRSGYDPNYVQEQGHVSGFIAGWQSTKYPNLPPGMAVYGDPGITKGLFEMPHVSAQPRVGAAYDLGGKGTTVITAAAGIYYQNMPLSNASPSAMEAPFGGEVSASNVYSIYNPWLTACVQPEQCAPGSPQATYKTSPLPLSLDPSVYTATPNYSITLDSWATPIKLSHTLQMNVGVQHQIIKGVSIRAGYVGNRQEHVQYWMNQNLPQWQPGATIANETQRTPYAYYAAIQTLYSNAHSRYDSLQSTMSVNRFGFYGDLNYTLQQGWAPWAQNNQDPGTIGAEPVQNPYNIKGDYSEGENRQSFNANMLYSIGKPHFDVQRGDDAYHWVPWSMDYIVRDWKVGGSFAANSGGPINVTWGVDQLLDATAQDRPDLIGKVTINRHPRVNTSDMYIDYKGFGAPPVPSAAAPHAFGNLPNNAFWGPGNWGLNATLTRAFPIKERAQFKLKVDASNVLNHPTLGGPNTSLGGMFDAQGNPVPLNVSGSPGSGNFGTISTKNGQRTLGLEGRFTF